MNIDNFKKICVIGWARTGISLCNLLLSLKKEVKVSEMGRRENFSPSLIDSFRERGVEFEFCAHSKNFIKGSQLIILSPGVDSLNSKASQIARELEIPQVGELEFSFWLNKAKIIAITGTNGKTTTTHLTYEVLKGSSQNESCSPSVSTQGSSKGRRVFLGGNIGTPFSSFVLKTRKDDLVVLEVSSFQLETILHFRPYVAVLLNIKPNHLDRYATFDDYVKAKMNIFRNQKKDDWAVVNDNIEFKENIEREIKSKLVYFSSSRPYFGKGKTNENFSCVYRIAQLFGKSKSDCLRVFSAFRGLPHRLQFVRKLREVIFINDSKSTNPYSTIWALKNTKAPIILIAGGRDKGLNYSSLFPFLKKVKKVNLFGEAAHKIKEELASQIEVEVFPSLQEAVNFSFKQAKSKDTVLFSPMCSSFDMFSNYEERGNKFIEIVNNLC